MGKARPDLVAKTHCYRGHPLTPDNCVKLVGAKSKPHWRRCKKCNVINNRKSSNLRALAKWLRAPEWTWRLG